MPGNDIRHYRTPFGHDKQLSRSCQAAPTVEEERPTQRRRSSSTATTVSLLRRRISDGARHDDSVAIEPLLAAAAVPRREVCEPGGSRCRESRGGHHSKICSKIE